MAVHEIGRLRKDIEPFQGELMEEFYRNFAGLKDEMSTVPIYDKYSHLFSSEAVESLKDGAPDEPTDDARWFKYLRAFVVLGHVDSATKVLSDRATTFEAQSMVQFGGEQIPYRFVPVRLRNERDGNLRRALFEAKLMETDKLNEILIERMATVHDLAVSLGFKNYNGLVSSLKGIDYKALGETVEQILKRTENIYTRTMDELLLERADISLSDAWSFDVPYAFRGEEFDKHFDKDLLTEAFFKTLRMMGIDPKEYANIQVDTEDRPKKSPRAFCAPVKVPEDIRLVIRPSGGWRDFEAFFHEGGHAWHFGCTLKKHPAEYRYLGDNSVTESFAFLFDYLTTNKTWLEKVLGMENADEFVRFALVNKLMFIRRYAAKLNYELKLHAGRITNEFQEIYRNSLQRSLKFKHTEKHFLEDVDDAFYCADYLRAWILEGQLRAALEEEYGEDWFTKEKAGKSLRNLWSYGQKYNADELVKTIGYVDLDEEPMVAEMERGLSD
ncbi:MAG TPA: hypothetical protein VJ489_04190 [Thermoplasmata archaeon]|nr:hypothetical protein [Thermoplasmata archaeon]